MGPLREVHFPRFSPNAVLAGLAAPAPAESTLPERAAAGVGVGYAHCHWVLLVVSWLERTDWIVVVLGVESPLVPCALTTPRIAGARPVAVRKSVARLQLAPLRLVPEVPVSRLLGYSV